MIPRGRRGGGGAPRSTAKISVAPWSIAVCRSSPVTTPASTYHSLPICIGGNSPGTAHEARIASITEPLRKTCFSPRLSEAAEM